MPVVDSANNVQMQTMVDMVIFLAPYISCSALLMMKTELVVGIFSLLSTSQILCSPVLSMKNVL